MSFDLLDDEGPAARFVPPPKIPATGRRDRRDSTRPVRLAGRIMPHSLEAEEYLLSCCLIDGHETIELCQDARLSADDFFAPANRIIYAKMIAIHATVGSVAIEVLAEELKADRQLDEIGGYPYLMQVSSRIPTTAQASYFIQKVRELSHLRRLIRASTSAVEQCYAYEGGLDDFIARVEIELKDVIEATRGRSPFEARGIAEFRYPADDDPNLLLGEDDYLSRGGGMLLVAPAGQGKSSIAMDMAMEWARARAFAGIKPRGRLRVLIIQSEDSERYVGRVAESYAQLHGLTDADRRALNAHVKVVKVKGVRGEEFMRVLADLVRRYPSDLVIINPIYLYCEGDISDSEDAATFLNGLDRVNREEKFAYILVHHTGKPPRGGDDKDRQKADWETAYMGIGSSFWANWPRCSLMLEPKAERGRYTLKLGKAGTNAGVRDTHGDIVTAVPMRHTQRKITVGGKERQAILWEPDTAEVAPDLPEKANQKTARPGPKDLYKDEEIVSYFPGRDSEPETLSVIERRANEGCGIKRTPFYAKRAVLMERQWIEQVDNGPYRRTARGDEFARWWQRYGSKGATEQTSPPTATST